MKKIFAILSRFFGVGEILFMTGMILLHRGVSVSFTVAWANTACGIILVLVGFLMGREAQEELSE